MKKGVLHPCTPSTLFINFSVHVCIYIAVYMCASNSMLLGIGIYRVCDKEKGNIFSLMRIYIYQRGVSSMICPNRYELMKYLNLRTALLKKRSSQRYGKITTHGINWKN